MRDICGNPQTKMNPPLDNDNFHGIDRLSKPAALLPEGAALASSGIPRRASMSLEEISRSLNCFALFISTPFAPIPPRR